MTADRLHQQNELHSLLTYFYRGHHNRSTWTPEVHNPQIYTNHSNQRQLHHHLLHIRWHFIAKPPRLKDHQRQPLEWKPSLNGRHNRLVVSHRFNNGLNQLERCMFVNNDGCGRSVSQQLTCEWSLMRLQRQWRPKEKPRFGGRLSANERLCFDAWQTAQTTRTILTLTCFVVGQSLFFVRMDLKWLTLNVEFRRISVNGQRTEVMDMFAFFRVAKRQERHQLVWINKDCCPTDDSLSFERIKGTLGQ